MRPKEVKIVLLNCGRSEDICEALAVLTWVCTDHFPWVLQLCCFQQPGWLVWSSFRALCTFLPWACASSGSVALRVVVTSSSRTAKLLLLSLPVMQSAVIDPLLGNRLCTAEVTVLVLLSIYCPCLARGDLEIYVCCV